MRSFEDARRGWQALHKFKTLRDLRDGVQLQDQTAAFPAGIRSVCWKTFLLFDTIDTSQWPRTLASSRSAYNALRTHFLYNIEHPEELGVDVDPLSGDKESPWAVLRKDEELRAEIQQDVDRCMPENLYFRQSATQTMLLDVLFIFCRLNPDVGYRQGMHEILAPILWVVEHDAIELGVSSKTFGEDEIIKDVFDADHIEHDTFALFGQVMQSAKRFYEQTTHSGTENPMVSSSKRIVSDLLGQVDVELVKHLEDIDVVPQVFLIRWIRLLFGREFKFDDLLPMWDVIFAEDASLEIVDHICLAMLLRIRWKLIEADYNMALTLLLRYPPPSEKHPPLSFVTDALYLRRHLDFEGGSYLILKYTGQPLPHPDRPTTPPPLQRNITTFSGALPKMSTASSPRLSPPRFPRQASNINAILQSTAKDIYSRGEKLGIGRTIRDTVNEVHKKARIIQAHKTPSIPSRQRAGSVLHRVKQLEERNKQLARLLEGAVAELWEHQKQVADDPEVSGNAKHTPEERSAVEVERLSIAIGKVQLVQVYLDDNSIPLTEDDVEQAAESSALIYEDLDPLSEKHEHSIPAPALFSPHISERDADPPTSPMPQLPVSKVPSAALADPSTFEDSPQPSPPLLPESTTSEPESDAGPSLSRQTSPAHQFDPHASRQTLAQSSFSWMLGQNQEPVGFANAKYEEPSEKRRAKGFLFGDDGDAGGSTAGGRPRSGSNVRHKKSLGKGAPVGKGKGGGEGEREEVIDLGTIRMKKKAAAD